jgi:uncharacterized protein YbcI
MIYEETYQYLLHNVSSTEFDVLMYCVLNSDWDGVIQAPLYQIAEEVGTTKKYLKQVIRKFTSSKRRKIFSPIQTEDGIKYQINLGLTGNLGFDNKTARYCKKYSFLYSDSFRKLSINAKRLLLMSAFRMSLLKNETVMFHYNEIVPSSNSLIMSFFTRGRLLKAIEEIQTSDIADTVSISLAGNMYTRTEVVLFSFKGGTLSDFISNYTERKVLRKMIFQHGFTEFISEDFCIEIEKVGKYIYNSLLSSEKENAKKQGLICDAKDELIKLARFIYNRSIEKFSKSLYSNIHLLLAPKQASAYFSAIVYNEMFEEMAKYAHQEESVKSLLDYDFLHKTISSSALGRDVDYIEVIDHTQPIRKKYEIIKHIKSVISDWCENWVISRVKSVVSENEEAANNSANVNEKVSKEKLIDSFVDSLDYISTLRTNTYKQIQQLMKKISVDSNKAIPKEKRTRFLEKTKESLSSFFPFKWTGLKFHLNNNRDSTGY